jgi:hypothetical protein
MFILRKANDVLRKNEFLHNHRIPVQLQGLKDPLTKTILSNRAKPEASQYLISDMPQGYCNLFWVLSQRGLA